MIRIGGFKKSSWASCEHVFPSTVRNQHVGDAIPGSTNGINTCRDPNATTLTTRFYRMHVSTP
jgi:hypothetical protein